MCPIDGWSCGMNGLMLYHLQGLMVIVDSDVPAIDVGMEPF